MLRFSLHYGIHFLVPIVIGLYFFKEHKLRTTILLLAGILIDVDHLIADPIFDMYRCSINYHPLHSYWAIGIYLIFLFIQKTRILGIALTIHIVADWVDCLLLRYHFE